MLPIELPQNEKRLQTCNFLRARARTCVFQNRVNFVGEIWQGFLLFFHESAARSKNSCIAGKTSVFFAWNNSRVSKYRTKSLVAWNATSLRNLLITSQIMHLYDDRYIFTHRKPG